MSKHIAGEWARYIRHINHEAMGENARLVLRMAFYSGVSSALTSWNVSGGNRLLLDELETEVLQSCLGVNVIDDKE